MTPWHAYRFCRATGLGRLKSLVTERLMAEAVAQCAVVEDTRTAG